MAARRPNAKGSTSRLRVGMPAEGSAYEIMGLLLGVASLLNAEVAPTSRNQCAQASATCQRIRKAASTARGYFPGVGQDRRQAEGAASCIDRAEGLVLSCVLVHPRCPLPQGHGARLIWCARRL
jgi:hypothetical protein